MDNNFNSNYQFEPEKPFTENRPSRSLRLFLKPKIQKTTQKRLMNNR